MLKPRIITFSLLFISLCISTSSFAESDITMHQVYLAAAAGKFTEAQSMMDKVLSEHPNSAKAHFVEAELLAKQGQLNKAASELNIAEALQPGLTFAKPQSVKELKHKIGAPSSNIMQTNINNKTESTSGVKEWLPTILLLMGLVLIILLIVKTHHPQALTILRQRLGNQLMEEWVLALWATLPAVQLSAQGL